MFEHVLSCTSYDFSALTPAMWKLWHWWKMCVFRLTSGRFLEQRFNI